MSIDQLRTVDLISTDADGTVVLTVSDHREWGPAEHLLQLHEKINSYLRFVESGEILENYPASAGGKIRIEIVCKFEPDEPAIHSLSHCKTVITRAGFELRCRMLNSETALLTEDALAEDWLLVEEDTAWRHLQEK